MNKEIENSSGSWDALTCFFHWASAVWVSGLLGLGLVMVHLVENSGTKFELYQVHKSYGFMFGLFLIARTAWKLWTPRPKSLDHSWTHNAATTNQALMLFILFALVISGYALTCFSILPIPISIFGLSIPSLLKPDLVMEQTAILAHHAFAFVLMALILAHTSAALLHHFILKDNTLTRMLGKQN
jgi:cytochrome b561